MRGHIKSFEKPFSHSEVVALAERTLKRFGGDRNKAGRYARSMENRYESSKWAQVVEVLATSRHHATKKSAKQLEREIASSLAKGTSNMESVTRERVLEPLSGERVTSTRDVMITLIPAIGPEPWKLVSTRGRNFGGANGGRILITLGGTQDPLAGLAWATEYGRPYVHHVWVDAEARGRGLSQVLFDAYREDVSPELVVVGPFTKGGRAAAQRAGAILED